MFTYCVASAQKNYDRSLELSLTRFSEAEEGNRAQLLAGDHQL